LKERRSSTAEVNKCVVYDVKGEFCAKHLDKGDLVFYPFDRSSIPSRFLHEIRDYPDLDVLGTSLYSPPKDCRDPYWYNAARDIFRTGLFYLLREKKTSNPDIWAVFSHTLQQLRETGNSWP